jgi:hypothetical protein
MRWTLTGIVLLSLLGSLLAAGICGNGVCNGDKNCSTCSLDCGKCKGGSCSLDNDCYSGICCSGVCSNSCVTYPTKSAGASPYVASTLSVGTYSMILGAIVFIIIIEVIIAFAILRGRKKI